MSSDVLAARGAVTSIVKLNHDNEGTTHVRNVSTARPATKRHTIEDLLLQLCTCLVIISGRRICMKFGTDAAAEFSKITYVIVSVYCIHTGVVNLDRHVYWKTKLN